MANYWAKVYVEILDDPKMGRLSDRLWRRTIELILMAKDENDSGYLPSLDDMAWRLRTNAELLEAELVDLARVGIVENRANGWLMPNFTKRQTRQYSQEPDAVRQREYRAKKKEEKEREQNKNKSRVEVSRDMSRDMSQDNPKTNLPPHLHVGLLPSRWDEWRQYHDDRGKPITVSTALRQFKEFERMGPEGAAAAIDYSIRNNYTGLVEPKPSSNGQPAEPKGFAGVRQVLQEIEHGNA